MDPTDDTHQPGAATTGDVDRDGLALAMSWLLAGTAIIVLDLRLDRFDVLFDPVGAVVVALGVDRVVRATAPSRWGVPARLTAWLHAAVTLLVEVGVLGGALAVGGAGLADTADATVTWTAVAGAQNLLTSIGIVLLAGHLRTTLEGVAADRWRQVQFAWIAELVVLPFALLTSALELVLLGLALLVIAGVLLLVALFATRRAAEEDDLGRQFPGV